MSPPIVSVTKNAAPDVDLLGTYIPVPHLGHFAVNAFLLRARQPVLVDTGIGTMQDLYLRAIESVIDPADLRFIYLTHVDGDHVGCLDVLLQRAPRARLVTTFLGMSKLGLTRRISPERFLLLNPGQTLDVGDRRLQVMRPPCFDAPETTMLWEPGAGTLFSSDYFGALVPAPVEAAEQVPAAALRQGMATWLSVDSPWIHTIQPAALERATRAVTELAPRTILGAHLAPARSLAPVLADNVLAAPAAPPFVGPDQAASEQLLVAGT